MFGQPGSNTSQLASPEPYDLWVQRSWRNQEVVGENSYLPTLQRLFQHSGARREEIQTTAHLLPEPANRHDRNAVVVQVGGHTVGYLPRDIAPDYQPLLLDLARRGYIARVPCQVWGDTFKDYDYDRRGRLVERPRFSASVTIGLPEPHLCMPLNAAPSESHALLPQGRAIQVSGELEHMAAIEPFLRSEGEAWAYATLHAVDQTASRTIREVVEVRLDGRRCGSLTPKMSSDLLPAIKHLTGLAKTTACRARVKGNRLKAEVTLHCARAHELPSDWPDTLASPEAATNAAGIKSGAPPISVHRPIPAKPTAIRFAAPPGWPPPPKGWEPPAEWAPDPSWPSAPKDWQFWTFA